LLIGIAIFLWAGFIKETNFFNKSERNTYLIIGVLLIIVSIIIIKGVDEIKERISTALNLKNESAKSNKASKTTDEIAKLFELYKAGAITEKEYESQKKNILNPKEDHSDESNQDNFDNKKSIETNVTSEVIDQEKQLELAKIDEIRNQIEPSLKILKLIEYEITEEKITGSTQYWRLTNKQGFLFKCYSVESLIDFTKVKEKEFNSDSDIAIKENNQKDKKVENSSSALLQNGTHSRIIIEPVKSNKKTYVILSILIAILCAIIFVMLNNSEQALNSKILEVEKNVVQQKDVEIALPEDINNFILTKNICDENLSKRKQGEINEIISKLIETYCPNTDYELLLLRDKYDQNKEILKILEIYNVHSIVETEKI